MVKHRIYCGLAAAALLVPAVGFPQPIIMHIGIFWFPMVVLGFMLAGKAVL